MSTSHEQEEAAAVDAMRAELRAQLQQCLDPAVAHLLTVLAEHREQIELLKRELEQVRADRRTDHAMVKQVLDSNATALATSHKVLDHNDKLFAQNQQIVVQNRRLLGHLEGAGHGGAWPSALFES